MNRMKQLSFIQLSDTHLRKNYINDPLEELFKGVTDPAINLTALLHNTDFENIDFMVITGDLVHDGNTDDYRYLKGLVEGNVPSNFPVYYCLGNHDDKKSFYQGFYDIEDKTASYDYTDVVNGYRLIFMDTSIANYHEGFLVDEQIDWLESILKEESESGSILFMHHPLVWNGEVTTNVSNRLFDLLEQSDLISIHSGHLHTQGVNFIGTIPQYSIDSLAFGLTKSNGMVYYTDRNSYNYYAVKDKNIFSNILHLSPTEQVYRTLTKEEDEKHTKDNYGG